MEVDIKNKELIKELLNVVSYDVMSDTTKYSTLKTELEKVLDEYDKHKMYYVSVEGENTYKDSVFSSYEKCRELEKIARQDYNDVEICSFKFNPIIGGIK